MSKPALPGGVAVAIEESSIVHRDVSMIVKWLVKCNNALTRRRHVRVSADNLLLLLPHCMQWNGCTANVKEDIQECRRCGRCRIGVMRDLAEKYHLRCVVASGGRRAIAEVRQPETRAVVAVACEKELLAGILATVPKPVLAVCNTRPCGDCHNTCVEPGQVEEAIRALLENPDQYGTSGA